MSDLPIGGITPFSATDYPSQLTLVVFCQGCPWRCSYCHNPHLQSLTAKGHTKASWGGVLALLKRRVGLLDAVVFSGGEPTAHKGLLCAIKEVKGLGYKVGLHTTGAYPDKLKEMLPFIDWVGFDVKAPFEKYETITQVPKSAEKARASLELILQSGVQFECRTTYHSDLLSEDDLKTIAHTLKTMGVGTFALQEFQPKGCLTETLKKPLLPPSEALLTHLKESFETFLVR